MPREHEDQFVDMVNGAIANFKLKDKNKVLAMNNTIFL